MNSQTHSNAYNKGHDYYTAGGRDTTDNPYPDGSTKYGHWEKGYEAAKTEQETTEMHEHFSDNCTH